MSPEQHRPTPADAETRLAQIRALCDEARHLIGEPAAWLLADKIRAVLDAPPAIPRDESHYYGDGHDHGAQGIDRDALDFLLDTMLWQANGTLARADFEKCLDRIRALVRPVEGVVLTREERKKLAYLVEQASYSSTLDIFVIEWLEEHGAALAARLEASE